MSRQSHQAIERVKKIASMSDEEATAYLRSEKRVLCCDQCGTQYPDWMRCRKCGHYFCEKCQSDHGCGVRFYSFEQQEREASEMSALTQPAEDASAERQALADAVKENAKLRELAGRLASELDETYRTSEWFSAKAERALADSKKAGLL